MGKLIYIIFCLFLFSSGIFFTYDSFFIHYNNKMQILSPNFVNKKYLEAEKISKELDLNLEVITEEYSNYPKGFIYLQIPEAYKSIKNSRTIRVAVSLGDYKADVNQFVNILLPNAINLIQQMGLNIKNISYVSSEMPFNQVISTYPIISKELYDKKQISLLVSAGKKDKIIKMPSLIKLNYEEALVILNEMELINIEPRYLEVKSIPKNIIMYQNPPANKELMSGSVVDLVISK